MQYLILTIPDETLYESNNWPSKFSTVHKWSFTIYKRNQLHEKSINIIDLIRDFGDRISFEKIELITDFYNEELIHSDQTHFNNTECSIEIIGRKL